MALNKIGFPHMGNYQIAFKLIAELAGEVMIAPPISKKTIELGAKYSPEAACIPFKYNLGNYIEALDAGTNILLQAGGGCRFGYYGEVQKEILKNLGYKFKFLKLTNNYNPFGILREFKKINPKVTLIQILRAFLHAYFRFRSIDIIEDFVRKNIGFTKKQEEFEKLFKDYLSDLDKTKSIYSVRWLHKRYIKEFKKIPVKKPKSLIRVGMVGELYVLMEPFCNFNIEIKLAKKGIEVHRFVTVSSIVHNFFYGSNRHLHDLLKHARPYLTDHIGAHGTASVAEAHKLVKEGFDGVIHVKPFGCMPEVNAMPALQKLSRDYKFPIIYFSFDSQTSETGIDTRLEAFYDMLLMKKNKKIPA